MTEEQIKEQIEKEYHAKMKMQNAINGINFDYEHSAIDYYKMFLIDQLASARMEIERLKKEVLKI